MITVRIPFSAKIVAIAFPIVPLPPVTIAVRPFVHCAEDHANVDCVRAAAHETMSHALILFNEAIAALLVRPKSLDTFRDVRVQNYLIFAALHER